MWTFSNLSLLFFVTLPMTTTAFATTTTTTMAFAKHSSKSLAMSSSSTTTTEKSDLAVVGVGVLGVDLCRQLLESPEFSDTTITGITKSTSRHELIRHIAFSNVDISEPSSRLILTTMEDLGESKKYKNVVFCAPPSGFDDYAGAVQNAITNLWLGPEGGGAFVFTSSGGIYGKGDDGETVTESSPTADPEANPRIGRLVKAEQVCRESGGCILRLAGLYNLDRGAHNYWLVQYKTNQKEVMGSEDAIINLLHYEDAASACLYALKAGAYTVAGRTFLISDGHPTTRKGICDSALKSKHYADYEMPTFTGNDGPGGKGKIYDGTWSDEQLQWKPTYASFDEYMSHH
uniref:NAD-dependent epimerase/dehydratase domain-containing protein n=3 Tax=Ditylum brightwellii TaxID=49249 RepID=A0A7S4QJR8_9STRA|mmetsp:Transcript_9084/g.12114  ORF Transcript_9084/g.12114 Transcript_9084/m.12114 type:complete len:346 (-) Transcript_9084:202-1239(-)